MLASAARRAARITGLRLTSSTAARSFSSLGSGLTSYSAMPYNAPLIRSFGSKKQKQKWEGDKGGGIKVMLWDEDESEYFEKPVKDMNDLIGKVAKAYEVNKEEITGGDYTLQVGKRDGLWVDLKSFQQIKEKAEEGSAPHVRLAELDYTAYEDEDDDDYSGDDDDKGEDYMDDELYAENIGPVIREMILELREAGWNRPDANLLKKASGEELAARDYILQAAKENHALRDTLVSRIGAMDHILQCLQYEFLWEDNDMDSDGEDPKEADFTEK